MEKEKEVLVGFSVNPEIVISYDRMTPKGKGVLESITPDLCGTSANVARAIISLGQSSKVLALTGVGDDFESHILRFSLENFPAPHSEFKILDRSHISVLPIDGIHNTKVFGKKGTIQNDKINETVKKINQEEGLWRVGTGIRPEEIQLVKALFNKHAGYRSLNPRLDLITNRNNFLEILKDTDLLIMNQEEFYSCEEASVSGLHRHGPKLVIVTQNSLGGIFSREGYEPQKFKPCTDYIKSPSEVYETGAGDWFHAAFIVRCIELGKSIHALTLEEIWDCSSFAARVSGKKVTIPGAANGPTRKELTLN